MTVARYPRERPMPENSGGKFRFSAAEGSQ
jgi:hypothetical protein